MKAFTFEINEGVANLCCDLDNTSVNILSFEVLRALERKLEEIKVSKEIKLLKFTSAKEGIFIAGADIADIQSLTDEEHAYDLVSEGQRILSKITELPFATLAVIDGACLGGGFELALCCDYRIATQSSKTKIGLPEVNLGVLPGFGGTQRLKTLTGLSKALELILGGKILNGLKAQKLGIVDACVPQGYLEFREKSFIEAVLKNPKKKSTKSGTLLDHYLPQLVFHYARKNVMEKTKGKYPAPLVILDLMEKTQDREIYSALDDEARAFAKLAVTPISKNLIALFFSSEALKKERGVKRKVNPIVINMISVVGAGVMGAGIVFSFSKIDKLVRMKLRRYAQAGEAMKSITKVYDGFIKRHRLSQNEVANKLSHISYTTEYNGFSSCDLALEAIVENVEAKEEVYGQLEKVMDEKAIIASNTSSLSISLLSEKMNHPERFVGMHFFNPVPRMPLVEIIAGKKTSDKTIATVVSLAKELGKTPIVVGDCAGFLVNRILIPYINEAVRMFEDGADFQMIDKVVEDFGMPMGPFTLADEVGLDVGYKVSKVLEEAYGERMKISPILDRVYHQMQLLGKKSGKGFYVHASKQKEVNDAVKALVSTTRDFSEKEIIDRTMLIMINEAAMCLEEKVVANAQYLDMAMVMGTGFPPFRGGLLRYADSIGLDNVVNALSALEEQYGIRFSPSKHLVRMAKNAQTFYEKDL